MIVLQVEGSAEKYGLVQGKKYKLLNKNGAGEGERDGKNFEALTRGLDILSFSQEAKDYLWRTLAALIHLGEVSFSEGSDARAEVVDREPIAQACSFLGMDATALEETLLVHVVTVAKTQVCMVRNATQARAMLESFMKMLYKRLFDSIVDWINDALNASAQGTQRSIGILDIYGFEKLELNSFEQLCINLANERLQQFFVQNVILEDHKTYEKEGIIVDPCSIEEQVQVEYIERIFALLDEHNRRLAKKQKTSDEQFTDDVHRSLQTQGPTAQFVLAPRRGRGGDGFALNEGFVVKHYAGDVPYATKQWLDKNNARLIPEMENLLHQSKDPLVARLSAVDEDNTTFTSVAQKYLADLSQLLDTLRRSNQHYIRCFKPNHRGKPHQFDDEIVKEQLVQCGTLDLIRVMHGGYPYRIPLVELTSRFDMEKLPFLRDTDPRLFLDALVSFGGAVLRPMDYVLGATYVFLRSQAVLEALLALEVPPEGVEQIKRHIRRKKLRRCFIVLTFCLWVPRGVTHMRRGNLVRKCVACARIYRRLHRWRLRATRHLRQGRLFHSLPKLRATVLCIVMFKRALLRAQRRLRHGETLRNVVLLQRLVLIIVALQRYVRQTLPEVRVFIKRSRRNRQSLANGHKALASPTHPRNILCVEGIDAENIETEKTQDSAQETHHTLQEQNKLHGLEEQKTKLRALEEENSRLQALEEENRKLRALEEENRKLRALEEENRKLRELDKKDGKQECAKLQELEEQNKHLMQLLSSPTRGDGDVALTEFAVIPTKTPDRRCAKENGFPRELMKENLAHSLTAKGGRHALKPSILSSEEALEERQRELAANRMERESLLSSLPADLRLRAGSRVKKMRATDYRNGELTDLYEQFGYEPCDSPSK